MPIYALMASRTAWQRRLATMRNAAVAIAYGLTLSIALGVVALWAFLRPLRRDSQDANTGQRQRRRKMARRSDS